MRDELDALREGADLPALLAALVRRGEAALERGDWTSAQQDLDEAAQVATLLGDRAHHERARRGAALAYRGDGRVAAARARSR